MAASPNFRTTSIDPAGCFVQGLDLVRERPLVFLAAGALVLLSGFVPFGVLLGPLLAGMHLVFRDAEEGRAPRLARLRDGFRRPRDAVHAGLLLSLAGLAVLLPLALVFVAGAVTSVGVLELAGQEADGLLPLMSMVVTVIVAIGAAFVALPFTFAFALIGEHGLTGHAAVKLSLQAARANFRGLAALWLLSALAFAIAYILYVVPLVLVFPVLLGSAHVAYRRVFGRPPREAGGEVPEAEPLSEALRRSA
jgi:hypothetical protein